MSNVLTASPSEDGGLEPYRGGFQVPKNWTSCGPGFYISGAPGIRGTLPVAIALTEETVSLCGDKGAIWSLHLLSIKDVKVTNLTGISFSVPTPAGPTYIVPPIAIGVELSFNLTETGAVGRVVWCTLSPQSARDWVNDITDAIIKRTYRPPDVDKREEGS